ncbi:MAG: copper resistance protein NlpE N-terminal domain-containing protein [Chitinophagales bacterium]
MKNLLFLIMVFLLFAACNQKKEVPAAIQLPATYAGIIPCADCMGIQYEIALKEDFTFEEQMVYMGKSDSVFATTGKWKVLNDSVVKLEKENAGMQYFLAEAGTLVMLDANGKRIEGGSAEMYYLRIGNRKNLAQLTAMSTDPFAAKRAEGIDFIATGNEPFWNVEIDFEKMIRFNTMDGQTMQTPIPAFNPKGNAIEYAADTESGKLTLQITAETCTDNMSGDALNYAVTCVVNGKTFTGCGRYLHTKAELNGTWQLHMLQGIDLDKEQLMKGKPVVYLDIAQSRIGGHTGCNNFNGPVTITENTISISDKIATTMMACPGDFEQRYLQMINNKTYRFTISENKLMLFSDDVVVMDFVRAPAQ